MTRVAVPTLALVFLCAIGAAAQSDSSSSSSSSKQTQPQKSSSSSKPQSNPPDAPAAPAPADKSAADQFPFPGDQEKGAQGDTPSQTQSTKQQGSQAGSNSQSGSKSSDNPDDLLNSPMTPPSSDKPSSEQFPFPEDQEKGNYSSSKDTQGDINPPSGDSTHPGADLNNAPDDVMETKPWDPHKADKDIEVGTFYFKQGNYKAAESRYREALTWQDNNAEAMYRLGATLEKEGRLLEARMYYEGYLKILPGGQFARDIHKQMEKMDAADNKEEKAASK